MCYLLCWLLLGQAHGGTDGHSTIGTSSTAGSTSSVSSVLVLAASGHGQQQQQQQVQQEESKLRRKLRRVKAEAHSLALRCAVLLSGR